MPSRSGQRSRLEIGESLDPLLWHSKSPMTGTHIPDCLLTRNRTVEEVRHQVTEKYKSDMIAYQVKHCGVSADLGPFFYRWKA